jgi:hypothetical protein
MGARINNLDENEKRCVQKAFASNGKLYVNYTAVICVFIFVLFFFPSSNITFGKLSREFERQKAIAFLMSRSLSLCVSGRNENSTVRFQISIPILYLYRIFTL